MKLKEKKKKTDSEKSSLKYKKMIQTISCDVAKRKKVSHGISPDK